MDFTFRSFYYQRNTDCSCSASSVSQSYNDIYFSQQPNHCEMESYNGRRFHHFLGNRDAMMERQLEKERIRREILEEEAAWTRRRELEAEVRRELRIERELELRRRGSDQWEAPAHGGGGYVEHGLFEKRVALSFQERMYDFPCLEQEQEKGVERMYDFRRLEQLKRVERLYDFPRLEQEKKVGGYEEELPFQRASQPIKTQVKTAFNVVKVEELPFQRAPQPIKTRVKTPLDVALDVVEVEELPFQRAPQPNKTEVKTSLNVVKAAGKKQITSLAKSDANYPGKKRKDMASSVEGRSEVTKKLTNEWTCALCRISTTSELGLEDHLKGKKHKSRQACQKAGIIGLCSKNIINPLNPSQVGDRNVESEKSQQTSKMPKNKVMNFKFYCKMCEVGAFSEEIMNSHKKGKKHLFRLHQLGGSDLYLEKF